MPSWIKQEQKDKVLHLFKTTLLTYEEIAVECAVTRKQVVRVLYANFSKEELKARKHFTYSASKAGSKNPVYSGADRKATLETPKLWNCAMEYRNTSTADFVTMKRVCPTVSRSNPYVYKLVQRPEWYTDKGYGGMVPEHHVVLCKALGITRIPEGHAVHHCDNNKYNNSVDNLVMLTRGEHTALHAYLRKQAVITGATTMSKDSTLKWVEARRLGKTPPLHEIV